jgi:hypothetical protein
MLQGKTRSSKHEPQAQQPTLPNPDRKSENYVSFEWKKLALVENRVEQRPRKCSTSSNKHFNTCICLVVQKVSRREDPTPTEGFVLDTFRKEIWTSCTPE